MEAGKKPKFWTRLHGWIHDHPTATYLIAGIGVIAAGALVAFAFLYQKPQPAEDTPTVATTKPAPPPPKYYSPLTGVEVKDEAATKQTVTAIMIENSPDARPQSGLKQAGIVFEAIAEGGITRFLTLHQEDKPQMIGPVRSLRMYYVDWLAPFDASVAHVGGSAAALAEIRNGHYRDIDQFFNGSYYWRATDRYAPHNVYTSFDKLDALNTSKGYTSSSFTGFPRTDGKVSDAPNATSIDVKISSALYNSHYDFDTSTNTYKRSEGGAAHLDREDGQIAPSVVIVIKTPMRLVQEDGWREQIDTIGSGDGYVFQNGTVTDITWSKAARGDQLIFQDKNGAPVSLVRGQTWITAIPANTGGASWQ